MIIQVYNAQGNISVDVTIDGISEAEYADIISLYDELLRNEKKSIAVANTYTYAIRKCPKANPADLWWHIIYRYYLSGSTDQSWKRTTVYATEIAFVKIYNPLRKP